MPGIHTSVLMCHAPIVIPEVATSRDSLIKNSTAAMLALAKIAVQKKFPTAVLVTPHSPRLSKEFSLICGPTLPINFSAFGFSKIKFSFPHHELGGQLLLAHTRRAHFPLRALALEDLYDGFEPSLDHGAGVPLYFLNDAGWRGKLLVIGLPAQVKLEECQQLGKILHAVADECKEDWLLVASGDMSHALALDAPCGFHPRAAAFDQFICEQIAASDLAAAVAVDPELRNVAREDVVDSLGVALGALQSIEKVSPSQLLSYECPFGVGYLNAKLFEVRDGSRQ